MTTLVDAHIARLAEDGRAVRTLDAYRCDAGELAMFVGGGQVGEALPARIDAALRSMRAAHGPAIPRRARTLLRGAHRLAVIANVLRLSPVRDVVSIGNNVHGTDDGR